MPTVAVITALLRPDRNDADCAPMLLSLLPLTLFLLLLATTTRAMTDTRSFLTNVLPPLFTTADDVAWDTAFDAAFAPDCTFTFAHLGEGFTAQADVVDREWEAKSAGDGQRVQTLSGEFLCVSPEYSPSLSSSSIP